MPRRNFQFYAELVLVTVLSLVAANAWVRWISQSLNYFFPGSLKVDFIVAIVMTAVAVWVLHLIFSDRDHSSGTHYHSKEDREGNAKDEKDDSYGAYDAGSHANGVDRRPEVRHTLYMHD